MKQNGSRALPGKMLDLGLLEICVCGGGVFPISSPCDGSYHAGSYPNPFPNSAGLS